VAQRTLGGAAVTGEEARTGTEVWAREAHRIAKVGSVRLRRFAAGIAAIPEATWATAMLREDDCP
jgi:hypothetical protein